ncbi:hypothetical protein C8F04DRAFT_1116530 [Mycena alexandri]|uniref:WW domain-containing protein n=1 Tax=Mycena alexandri TaxID=1745969 RepID=A0AAD6WW15_9AGAR|nr:hypothetical protein C8F04DRAFT_1116530 [Mycena alexandri]
MPSSALASVLNKLRRLWAFLRRCPASALASSTWHFVRFLSGSPAVRFAGRHRKRMFSFNPEDTRTFTSSAPKLTESSTDQLQPPATSSTGYSTQNEQSPTSASRSSKTSGSVSSSLYLLTATHNDVSPPSTVLGVVPILPEQFARYRLRDTIPREKTEVERKCRIQPETFDLSADWEVPVGWKVVMHPEGARYFVDPQRRILTDTDLCEPRNLSNINRVVDLIVETVRTSSTDPARYSALLGEGTSSSSVLPILDLVIDIDPSYKNPEKGYYYFIDHSPAGRTAFWVHPFQAEELEVWDQIAGPISRKHLSELSESARMQLSWNRACDGGAVLATTMFPSALSLSKGDIRELKDLLAFSVADMTTSTRSTVSSSLEELRHWMAVAKHLQCDSLGSATAFAKIMDCFAQTKFLNFYGLPCARLNQDQSVYPARGSASYLFLLASPLLFYTPNAYLESLERFYVDGLVLTRIWKPFIFKLNEEWQEFTLIGTVLLAVNVAFLSVNSVDTFTANGHHTTVQTLSYVSTLASAGSIIIGSLLVRQNRTKIHDTAAGISTSIHRRTSKRFGLEPLAVIFSLPHSLAVWSMLAFFAAMLVACTSADDVARTTTGAVSAFVGVLVFWCVYDAWDMQAADQAPFGLVLRRRIGMTLRRVWEAGIDLVPKARAWAITEKQRGDTV